MEKIVRKGIAFDVDELASFDEVIKKRGYRNRSLAIRDMIRKEIVDEKSHDPEERMIASLTIFYNHHEHHVQHELTDIQHQHHDIVRSGLHVHVDEENCLEVLVLEGRVKDICALSDAIIASKGIRHGKLVMSGAV